METITTKSNTEPSQAHFEAIDIARYRALSDVHLGGLGRVNLVVGSNAAGKTSVLEAVYLLANQSGRRALPVFRSSLSFSDPELLVLCNEESIRLKLKERVVSFIRNIDAGVRDVVWSNEHRRFLVTHDAFEAADLSSFGEGIQRVFLTGLLFAGARGGIVLIDEFENSLHTGLLLEFTKLVHELASEFQCQVFLTTHSKETVDAFLMNEYRTDEIVAYLLKREGSATKSVVRFSGPDLKRAVEVGDVDLRRL